MASILLDSDNDVIVDEDGNVIYDGSILTDGILVDSSGDPILDSDGNFIYENTELIGTLSVVEEQDSFTATGTIEDVIITGTLSAVESQDDLLFVVDIETTGQLACVEETQDIFFAGAYPNLELVMSATEDSQDVMLFEGYIFTPTPSSVKIYYATAITREFTITSARITTFNSIDTTTNFIKNSITNNWDKETIIRAFTMAELSASFTKGLI
jgi:hypothetical protein